MTFYTQLCILTHVFRLLGRFWTHKPLKSTPQDTQIKIFLKMSISSWCLDQHTFEFVDLHIIPMTLYKEGYYALWWINSKMFMAEIWVYYGPPSKIRMPQSLTIANFGHPVSKSWLRPAWPGFGTFPFTLQKVDFLAKSCHFFQLLKSNAQG